MVKTKLDQLVENILSEVVAFRQELHAHPELSLQEYKTAQRIRDRLAKLPGVQVLDPLIETDVVAILNGDKPGRCMALRADIDALPIEEQTDVSYKSTIPGVMHACGHDGHTATLVGSAMVLSAMADDLPGKVKFIFQPAEEHQGGADKLCQRGVLESPKVDAAMALHAWPMQPVGTLAVRSGPATAANNELRITVRGRGGHGAYPHRCIDPIVVAAHIITALQTVVARVVAPLDSAVVSVGRINAGSASNIIPSECEMLGTIRYYRPETGELIRQRVRQIAECVAQAHGAEAEVHTRVGYPSLINDVGVTQLLETTARELFGNDRVVTTEDPSMGAEDFAFFAQRVPAAMFRLGIRPEEMDVHPGLHHPKFNFNDAALPTGIKMFCEATRRFLNNSK